MEVKIERVATFGLPSRSVRMWNALAAVSQAVTTLRVFARSLASGRAPVVQDAHPCARRFSGLPSRLSSRSCQSFQTVFQHLFLNVLAWWHFLSPFFWVGVQQSLNTVYFSRT